MATPNLLPLPPRDTSLPLKFYMIDLLGSETHPNYRELLRKQLFMLLKDKGFSPSEDILDLSKKPEHPDLNISLSHGPTCSVLAWIERDWNMGIDIEEIDRLNINTINRISTPQEVANAPEPLLLWSAKEAVIKALYQAGKVMSSVEIINWKNNGEGYWTFGLDPKIAPKGYGEVSLIMGHSIAFFTSPS